MGLTRTSGPSGTTQCKKAFDASSGLGIFGIADFS